MYRIRGSIATMFAEWCKSSYLNLSIARSSASHSIWNLDLWFFILDFNLRSANFLIITVTAWSAAINYVLPAQPGGWHSFYSTLKCLNLTLHLTSLFETWHWSRNSQQDEVSRAVIHEYEIMASAHIYLPKMFYKISLPFATTKATPLLRALRSTLVFAAFAVCEEMYGDVVVEVSTSWWDTAYHILY